MSFEVITIPRFKRDIKHLVKKYPSVKIEFAELINRLEVQPEQGVKLGNNCFKIRLAIASKGKGKSGGARVITCVKFLKLKFICLLFLIKAIKKVFLIKNCRSY